MLLMYQHKIFSMPLHCDTGNKDNESNGSNAGNGFNAGTLLKPRGIVCQTSSVYEEGERSLRIFRLFGRGI